ncbi:hypothetical protein [Paenibacillus sp. V4I7]|uniref:hypothetical protein n=1 Tax=Paenibacillus sp. V4I7 TaxID=3042307 RepID=UPI002784E9E8|nr:hypothetical protein [Paenibacillus sp. V4I7]MDQ0899946.1 hypothetical protein [Paenibacillus sp. V4I7]
MTWHYGRRADVAAEAGSIPLLQDAATFEEVRRSTIVNAIQGDLEYFINQYNESARRIGIAYTFTLPTISQEEWDNTLNDVGVIAFVQGLPMGSTIYNHYALGGSRLIKRDVVKGAVDIANGVKYYFRSTCSSTFTSADYRVEETFSNEREAASAGYNPLQCVNPELITHKHN